jgi:hypothetical protein
MTINRGHQSIYFKDPEVHKGLEKLSEKDLKGEVSVSAIVCEVMGKALPSLIKAVKGGKRQGIQVSVVIDL